MLDREIAGAKSPQVTLFNPSVGDFVLRGFASDAATIAEVLLALGTPASLWNLFSIHLQKTIPTPTYEAVLSALAKRCWPGFGGQTDFPVCVANLVIRLDSCRAQLQPELRQLAQRWFELVCATSHHAEASVVGTYFLEQGWVAASDTQVLEWIRYVIGDSSLDEDLIPVSAVIQHIDGPNAETAAVELGSAVIDSWKEQIDDKVKEEGLLADYHDVDYHLDRAEDAVVKFVKDGLDEYSIEFSDAEIHEIVSACDIREIVEENESSFSDDDDSSHFGGGGGSSGDDTAAIDDLFDRNR